MFKKVLNYISKLRNVTTPVHRITPPFNRFKIPKHRDTSTQLMFYKLLTNHMPVPTKPVEHSLFNNVIYIPGSESPNFYIAPQQTTYSTKEQLTYLSSNLLGDATFINHQNNHKNIVTNTFSEWPEFLNNMNGSAYITLGYRRWLAHNHLPDMQHAVLFVGDLYSNYGVFGYNKLTKESPFYIINDLDWHYKKLNSGAIHYTFYDNLTIYGTTKQTKDLLTQIEKYSGTMFYTGMTSNCYTPFILGLIEAEQRGFSVPEQYKNRVLMAVSKEQNLGYGVINNKWLREHYNKAKVNKINLACDGDKIMPVENSSSLNL